MINLENNGRLIAKDITAYEGFIKIALIENFIIDKVVSNKQLDEIHEVYIELRALHLSVSRLDYLIYNVSYSNLNIETLDDFLQVLVNNPDYILDFITDRD